MQKATTTTNVFWADALVDVTFWLSVNRAADLGLDFEKEQISNFGLNYITSDIGQGTPWA